MSDMADSTLDLVHDTPDDYHLIELHLPAANSTRRATSSTQPAPSTKTPGRPATGPWGPGTQLGSTGLLVRGTKTSLGARSART